MTIFSVTRPADKMTFQMNAPRFQVEVTYESGGSSFACDDSYEDAMKEATEAAALFELNTGWKRSSIKVTEWKGKVRGRKYLGAVYE